MYIYIWICRYFFYNTPHSPWDQFRFFSCPKAQWDNSSSPASPRISVMISWLTLQPPYKIARTWGRPKKRSSKTFKPSQSQKKTPNFKNEHEVPCIFSKMIKKNGEEISGVPNPWLQTVQSFHTPGLDAALCPNFGARKAALRRSNCGVVVTNPGGGGFNHFNPVEIYMDVSKNRGTPK